MKMGALGLTSRAAAFDLAAGAFCVNVATLGFDKPLLPSVLPQAPFSKKMAILGHAALYYSCIAAGGLCFRGHGHH